MSGKQIIDSIGVVARRLGRVPSRAEFTARSGISAFFVLQWFRSWSDAIRAAGLRPYTRNAKVEDRALLEDWGNAVRKNRGILPRHIHRRKAKYNPCTLANRFGGWTSVPEAFRKFAKGKRKWADVVALLPAPQPRVPAKEGVRGRPNEEAVPRTPASKRHHAPLKDRPVYGNPSHFRGLGHEPVNEQGVVLLFGMLARELGYVIEAVQTGFPDCEAKRQIAPGRWQRVCIEFEFESRNFRDHGHPASGCDVIVCWRHNWEECPENIEVVELSKVIKSVAKAED
jgi:Homing endonuclease associated repeat